jgi:hypothetical protein
MGRPMTIGEPESRRGPLPDDHHRNPSTIPFVSFAAFCSNPLRCLLLRIDSKRFGRRSNIDPDRPAHRHRPLHLAAPFKPRARRGRGRWRTGESPRTLPDDHHRNPTSIPFVSFAAFCSNPLCCLLLCIVRAFKSARASFCRLR